MWKWSDSGGGREFGSGGRVEIIVEEEELRECRKGV